MYSGGGERTAIYESMMLQRMGHNVTCFAPAIRTDLCFPDFIGRIDLQGVIPRVRMKIPFRDLASMLASSVLAPLFAEKFKDFDVILSHGQPATWIGYLISRVAVKPRATYLHQPARFLYPRPIDLRVGWRTKADLALLQGIVETLSPLARRLDHASVASSDVVMTNSYWIGEQIRKIYGVEVIVCPPGVDTDKFVPADNKTSIEVKGHAVAKPFILSTNRHYPQKGLADLIRIFALVRKSTDVRLVVTGDFTSYTPFLKRLSLDLGVNDRVFFTGYVPDDDLARLYQNADVYAFTSPEEDFGLGPLEAMACGTPAVVWDYAGPSETVVDGINGYKVKPYNLRDFSDKILGLLFDQSLNYELGKNGARFVRERFTWTKHVATVERTLSRLAARS
jgi:glycosyltransferase involved in cell wall biosynthesis